MSASSDVADFVLLTIDWEYFVQMAMKIDKSRTDPRGGTIKMEFKVMSRMQQCPHVCRVSRDGCGQHDGRQFLVMELLGVNLAQMRSASPGGRFSGEVVKFIGEAGC